MKIVLPGPLASELESRVRTIAPDAPIVYFDEQNRPLGDVSDATILLRWWGAPAALAALVEPMRALRWLHIPRAGVDSSLVQPVLERDIIITNSAGVHATPIAEWVLLFMLSHVKQVPALLRAQAERAWAGGGKLQLDELAGKTLLVIGMGQIGQAIATRATAFGVRVWGSSRSGRPVEGVERVVAGTQWRALLGEADFVVIAAPLTPETRTMFGAEELAAMKPTGYLINIARGEIIHEQALIDTLRTSSIAGAALDVFAQEPLPEESPLWALPNVFATPHISWNSPHVRPRTLALFLDNLRRFVAGEPLVNRVDKDAGY
ncbi:MAG: D-2-hydroxyacid dehydrogenase [Chloroflexales bacterium]|nr:D-2-hydroxyacid dehydrogenase [Chloroflexales bacterium]